MWRFKNRPRKNATVAIVVPHHRFPLTADEETSLRHLRHHLGGFDTYWVGPAGVAFEGRDFRVQTFDPAFFATHAGYNRLLMSKVFYEAFAAYEFMLVYQLDCLVFNGALEAWCHKGWDYVGAPWIDEGRDGAADTFRSVGNGGLSLRRVSRHLEVLNARALRHDPLEYAWQTPRATSLPFLQRIERRIRRNFYAIGVGNDINACVHDWLGRGLYEDGFWATQARYFCPDFRIPDAREALPFSFETAPSFCFQENGGRLPFGCHAWAKNDRAFWKPYLLPAGQA